MQPVSGIVRISAICLLFFTGINAIVAGLLFIIDPSGNTMGMSVSYLRFSPFSGFLIPGIILLVVNGLMNLFAAIACIKYARHFPVFMMIQGLLLCGWICIQVWMVRDFNGLHFFMLFIGILLIMFGLLLKRLLKWPYHPVRFNATDKIETT